MTDDDLSAVVLRARAGERAAVEALVRRYLRPAYAVALAVLRVPAEAEDVAQEAVSMAISQLEALRDPARFAAYLMTNVRNRALNHVQSSKVRARFAEHAAPEAWSGPDADRLALRQELVAVLERLSPQQREVVLLHDLESWTHREIGSALGMSEVNSRQVLSVARRTLRRALEQQEQLRTTSAEAHTASHEGADHE